MGKHDASRTIDIAPHDLEARRAEARRLLMRRDVSRAAKDLAKLRAAIDPDGRGVCGRDRDFSRSSSVAQKQRAPFPSNKGSAPLVSEEIEDTCEHMARATCAVHPNDELGLPPAAAVAAAWVMQHTLDADVSQRRDAALRVLHKVRKSLDKVERALDKVRPPHIRRMV